MLGIIILTAAVLFACVIGVYCIYKREDDYWDWLANYNLKNEEK